MELRQISHRASRLSTMGNTLPIAVFCILALFPQAILAGYSEYDYSMEGGLTGNRSFTEHVYHPLKFGDFIGASGPQLRLIQNTVCKLSYQSYIGNITAREALGPVADYCWTHANCLLSTVNEHVKASFGGTSVLLGLTPTTLSILGPSVAEMALLSIHRPFLSLVLSLGAPAVFPGRFLQWNDPLNAKEPSTGALIVPRFGPKAVVFVSFMQYLLALGCLANIVHATYRVGIQSVLSWNCARSHWPLVWVFMSAIIHFMAVVSLRTAIRRKKEDSLLPIKRAGCGTQVKAIGSRLVGAVKNEVTPCSNSSWLVSDLYNVKLGPLPVTLQYAGAFFAVFHLVFGTLMFGCLLFLEVTNATILVLRMMVSAGICRIVLQFEVGGMIKVDQRRVYKCIVQAPLQEKSA